MAADPLHSGIIPMFSNRVHLGHSNILKTLSKYYEILAVKMYCIAFIGDSVIFNTSAARTARRPI